MTLAHTIEKTISDLRARRDGIDPNEANEHNPMFLDWNRGYYHGQLDELEYLIAILTRTLSIEQGKQS